MSDLLLDDDIGALGDIVRAVGDEERTAARKSVQGLSAGELRSGEWLRSARAAP